MHHVDYKVHSCFIQIFEHLFMLLLESIISFSRPLNKIVTWSSWELWCTSLDSLCKLQYFIDFNTINIYNKKLNVLTLRYNDLLKKPGDLWTVETYLGILDIPRKSLKFLHNQNLLKELMSICQTTNHKIYSNKQLRYSMLNKQSSKLVIKNTLRGQNLMIIIITKLYMNLFFFISFFFIVI